MIVLLLSVHHLLAILILFADAGVGVSVTVCVLAVNLLNLHIMIFLDLPKLERGILQLLSEHGPHISPNCSNGLN